MTENDLVKRLRDTLDGQLPGCFQWKIADGFTGGLPDLEVDWAGYTSKFEFKLLKPTEDLHKKWEDARQLWTCRQLERTTTRCWVVAFVLADKKREVLPHMFVFRPSVLETMIPFVPFDFKGETMAGMDAPYLWENGVIKLMKYDYAGIARLIRQTHQ